MDDRPVHVLHVDDEPDFGDLTATYLEREDDRFAVRTATSAAEGLDSIGDRPPDCIVSDYDMPGRNGVEFLQQVRETHPDLPFILFTGKGSEEVASEALRAGATDYIQKQTGSEQYELLANRIRNAVTQYRSEQRLQETTEEYATVFKSAQNGLLLVDASGEEFRYQRCNPRALELIGRERAEIVGQTPREALGPENGKKVAGAYRACVERGDAVDYTLTLALPVGEVVRDCRVTPVTSSGAIDQLVVSFHDVTERRERERELRAERRFVEQALDALDDLFYVLDTDGSIERWNERVVDVTGHDPATLDGLPAVDLFPDDDKQTIANGIETTLREGEATVEAELLTADGERIPYEFTGGRLTDVDGTTTGLVGVGRDISHRRRRERELETLTSQYRALIDNFPGGGVFLFDADLRFVRAGGDELDEVGLASADIEGATPHDLFPDDVAERHVHYFERTLAGESHTYREEFRGSHYEIRTMPIRDDAGAVIYGMAVSRDVSDQVERKRSLEQQNERLEEFASVVSHDLRNPLNVAEGRLELARADCDCAHLDDVADAVERCQALVDDVLTLARSGEAVGETEPVSLPTLARRCWEVIPESTGELTVETTQTVSADRRRLRQLLENLFANAVEHGATDGQDETGAGDTADRAGADVTVTVGDLPDGFYVADDGVGIPEDERDEVFEAGYSTDPDGTGFGLRIVRQIAEAHGWEIGVTDADSGGARFEVTGVAGAGDIDNA